MALRLHPPTPPPTPMSSRSLTSTRAAESCSRPGKPRISTMRRRVRISPRPYRCGGGLPLLAQRHSCPAACARLRQDRTDCQQRDNRRPCGQSPGRDRADPRDRLTPSPSPQRQAAPPGTAFCSGGAREVPGRISYRAAQRTLAQLSSAGDFRAVWLRRGRQMRGPWPERGDLRDGGHGSAAAAPRNPTARSGDRRQRAPGRSGSAGSW